MTKSLARLYSFILLCIATVLLSSLSPKLAHAQEDFLEPAQAFKLHAHIDTNQNLSLIFDIAPEYYMYRERFELKAISSKDNSTLSTLSESLANAAQFSHGEVKYDPTFDKEMEVYHHQATIKLPLLATNGQSIPIDVAFTLEVTAQGCADAGLCYPPVYYYVPISPTSIAYEITLPKDSSGQIVVPLSEEQLSEDNTSTSSVNVTTSTANLDLLNAADTDIAHWLNKASLWHMLAIAFLLGLALSFTPCVLPMLPILLSLVVGTQHAQQSRFHSLRLTLLYVLGTSIVYTLLGVAAASLGAALANWIQNPWVLSIFALFLVGFGIAMFGAYNLQMPSSVQSKLNTLVNKLPAGQNGGALLMGMLSALICGPCVAAPLAGVLLFISQTGDIGTGAVILFVLAWGQGVSLIILGSSSGALLPKAGMWMEAVKKVCGLLLFAAALWMTAPLMPDWLPMLLWALLALAFAYVVGTFSGYKPFPRVGALIVKLIGWCAVIWAVLLITGLSLGSRSVLNPLQIQQNTHHIEFERIHSLTELKQILASSNKPVILDFYADWCISCREMEKFTFSHEDVYPLMQEFRLLQVDVTQNTAQDRELLKAFRLFGPPGIIFFDRQGQENSQVRVIGFQNSELFKQNLQKALQQ